MGKRLKAFESLLTTLCRFQLSQLGYSQNSIKLFWLLVKNWQKSLSMATAWTWKGCNDESNIFLTTWIELVMTMILETFSLLEAWLILHLIAKSSALVLMTKVVWWRVLISELLAICMCEMNVAMSFLMLTSITIIAVDGEVNNSITMLSSCWRWILSFFSLLDKLKEKQSEKLSIILKPRESFEWRGEKEGKISLDLLSESTKWPLTWDL